MAICRDLVVLENLQVSQWRSALPNSSSRIGKKERMHLTVESLLEYMAPDKILDTEAHISRNTKRSIQQGKFGAV
jgi:hypothetical protein